MPFCARSKAPARLPVAPVKAPFTCPKSSLSMRFDATAEQSKTTNGPVERFEWVCTASATSSLPVPLSPSTSTVMSVGDTRSRRAKISRMDGDWPIIRP